MLIDFDAHTTIDNIILLLCCVQQEVIDRICEAVSVICVGWRHKTAGDMSDTLEAIQYKHGKLKIIDQLLLPHSIHYIDIHNTHDGWRAIHDMQVCLTAADISFRNDSEHYCTASSCCWN